MLPLPSRLRVICESPEALRRSRAVRSGEVRGAVWEEVDLDAGLWTIPGDRKKAGHQHKVPLSSRAIEVLAEVRVYGTGSGALSLAGMPLAGLVREG